MWIRWVNHAAKFDTTPDHRYSLAPRHHKSLAVPSSPPRPLRRRWSLSHLVYVFVRFDEVHAEFAEWRLCRLSELVRYPGLHGEEVRPAGAAHLCCCGGGGVRGRRVCQRGRLLRAAPAAAPAGQRRRP